VPPFHAALYIVQGLLDWEGAAEYLECFIERFFLCDRLGKNGGDIGSWYGLISMIHFLIRKDFSDRLLIS
jgi:hypothetical protein